MAVVRSNVPPVTTGYAIVFRSLEGKRTTWLQHASDCRKCLDGCRDVLHHLTCNDDVELLIDVRQKVIHTELRPDQVGAPRIDLQVLAARLHERTHTAPEVEHFKAVRRPLRE